MIYNYNAFVNEQNSQDNDSVKPNVNLEPVINTHIIEIQQDKKKTFDKVINKISRLCKFMGIPEPVVTKISENFYYTIGINSKTKGFIEYDREHITNNLEEIKKIQNDLINKNTDEDKMFVIYKTLVDKYEVKLVDTVKPENEWTLLGVIDHKELLVKAAPNQHIPTNIIPTDLSSCNCDHCQIERSRNKTVFIKNNKTNEILRVGGSCIKYYLGYDYKKILDYISELNLFIKTYSEDKQPFEFRGMRYDPMQDSVSTKDVIKYFFMYIRTHTFISKSSAEKINSTKKEGEKMATVTAYDVNTELNYIFTDPNDKQSYTFSKEDKDSQQQDIEKWEKDCKVFYERLEREPDTNYDEFVTYVSENYEENNFLFNVNNMIKTNSVPKHQINYVLSACSMFQGKKQYEEFKRKSEDEKQQKIEKEKKESDWVGVVGSTMPLENLKIVHISGFDGKYGWTNIYKLKDEKGNNFTKFGTINPKFLVDGKLDVEVGSVVSFVAEITKQDTYNDIKQTTIGKLSKI